MSFHWHYRSLPELAHLSRPQRDYVWRRASGRAWGRWQSWAGAGLAFCLLCGVQTALIVFAVPRLLGGPGGVWGIMVFAALFGVSQVLVLNLLTLRVVRRHLWAELGTRCVACGYDLTGNHSGRCPECGREVAAAAPKS